MDEHFEIGDHLEKAKNGDSEAFEQIVRHYYTMIFNFAYKLSNHHQTAQDICQETFIRAGRGIRNFEGRSKLSTWLYRIAVSIHSNYQRKNKKFETLEDWKEECDSTSPDAFENETILLALQELPEAQRKAIILHYYDGFNHAEIGNILNCSETTVSWRIFTARKKLKKILTQMEVR